VRTLLTKNTESWIIIDLAPVIDLARLIFRREVLFCDIKLKFLVFKITFTLFVTYISVKTMVNIIHLHDLYAPFVT